MSQTYTISNKTAGAAATKSLVELTAAANARVKIRGVLVGSNSQTTAQAEEIALQRCSATGTGTAFTPEKCDADSPSARSSAKSTMTANGTSTGENTVEVGFDVVGTYVLWLPPGCEIWIANSGIIDVRKTVGAETGAWSCTLFFEE